MIIEARLPEHERLRLLAIMGVDVYALRGTPLARTDAQADETAAHPVPAPGPRPSPPTARVRISGVGKGEHPVLLAAVMRSARLRNEDRTTVNATGDALPAWHFGDAGSDGAAPHALVLPALAAMRDSVPARREAWSRLRAWLRRG